MRLAIRRACETGATIDSVLNTTNGMVVESIFSSPSSSSSSASSSSASVESNHYFSALLSNQPRISNRSGVVGLLLLPCPEIISSYERSTAGSNNRNGISGNNNAGGGNAARAATGLNAGLCRLYLVAVSTHVDTILGLWNHGTLDSRRFDDLMKAIRCAASVCSEFNRSTVSSSGILYALSKLAKGYRRKSSISRNRSGLEGNAVSSSMMMMVDESNDYDNQQQHQLTSNILTPAHVEFLQCCLLASQYNFARSFTAQNPIRTISTSKSSNMVLSSESYLRYHYFLGMVHMGCDDYTSAISAFETCLTVPSKIVSCVTVEARKKMLLAECLRLQYDDEELYYYDGGQQGQQLDTVASQQSKQQKRAAGGSTSEAATVIDSHTGGSVSQSSQPKGSTSIDAPPLLTKKILDLPNAVSSCVHRYFTSTSSSSNTASSGPGAANTTMPIYESIVKAFLSLDIQSFNSIIIMDEEQLVEDSNLGLAKQLLPLMQYRKLKKISNIYEAIPMAKLAEKLGLSSRSDSGSDDQNGLKAVESFLLQTALRHKAHQESDLFCPLLESHVDFTIDSESSVVYFDDVGFEDNINGGSSDGAMDRNERENVQAELSKRVALSMDLAERITKMDIAAVSSTKYQAILERENPEDGVDKATGDGGRGKGGGSQSVII